MASSKATTLLFMIAMIVFLASLEVGEGIRWKTDKICYKECSDKCAAATRSLCEGMCKLECTFMECFFCVKPGAYTEMELNLDLRGTQAKKKFGEDQLAKNTLNKFFYFFALIFFCCHLEEDHGLPVPSVLSLCIHGCIQIYICFLQTHLAAENEDYVIKLSA